MIDRLEGTAWSGGLRQINRTLISIAASQTDSVVQAAQAGLRIHIVGFKLQAASTPSTFVWNTKPGGAGSAISQLFSPAASAFFGEAVQDVVPLYSTAVGEGLTASTGAGGTVVGVLYWYAGV